MRRFRRLFLLVVPLLVVISPPVYSQSPLDQLNLGYEFSLGYEGVPLKYERVLNYKHPYPPKAQGLLIESAKAGDPVVRSGLRVGNIIVSVEDTPVETVDDIREVVIHNFGRPLTFEIYKKTPRYEHRLRDDPFYEPERGTPYELVEVTATYDTPGLERNPVVAGKTRQLYHKRNLEHSPDTSTNTVYLNPNQAQQDGLSSCPVCFPSGQGGSLQNMLQEEFVGENEISSGLTQGADRVQNVPGEIQSIVDQLSRHLIRDDLDPTIALFQGDRMFGFGLPSGEIIFSYNIYRYAELQPQQELFLGHLLAHADREHDHKPVQENQIRSLIERAIQETTGVDFQFSQLKEWSPALPGFSYYNEVLEEGYGDPQEREAIFYAMLYRYRAGKKLEGARNWITRKRDMLNNLHPYWLDFTLAHPIPAYIQNDIKRWKELIPKHFDRKPGPGDEGE